MATETPFHRARWVPIRLLALAFCLLAPAPSGAFTIVFELLAPFDDEFTGLTEGERFEVRARVSGDPVDATAGEAIYEVDHFVAVFPNGDFVAEQQGAPGEIPGMSLTLRNDVLAGFLYDVVLVYVSAQGLFGGVPAFWDGGVGGIVDPSALDGTLPPPPGPLALHPSAIGLDTLESDFAILTGTPFEDPWTVIEAPLVGLHVVAEPETATLTAGLAVVFAWTRRRGRGARAS